MKALLCLVLLISFGQVVLADQEGVSPSYTAVTPDKKHIFVMLSGGFRYGLTDRQNELYPASGMYLNDGSSFPLWTVDWTAGVYLPNGGDHVVRLGCWPRFTGTYNEEAFSFIDHGVTLKTYRGKDLVDFPWLLLHSASHYRWGYTCLTSDSEFDRANEAILTSGGTDYPNNLGASFDNENQVVEIGTFHGDLLKFDLQTGDLIAASRPSRVIFAALVASLLLGYFLFRYLRLRKSVQANISKFSSLIIGAIFSVSILLLPAISIGFTQVRGNCSVEGIPTLSDQIWLSFYLFPIYFTHLFFQTDRTDKIVITISSMEAFLPALGFWLLSSLIFVLLDRGFVVILKGILNRRRLVT